MFADILNNMTAMLRGVLIYCAFLLPALSRGHAAAPTSIDNAPAGKPHRTAWLADMRDGSLLLGPYMRIFEDKAVPNFDSTRSVI